MIKDIGNGVYAEKDKKYVICKTFDGAWSVFRVTSVAEKPLEFCHSYTELEQAIGYVDGIH